MSKKPSPCKMSKPVVRRLEKVRSRIIRLERLETVLQNNYSEDLDQLLKHYRLLVNEVRRKIESLTSERESIEN